MAVQPVSQDLRSSVDSAFDYSAEEESRSRAYEAVAHPTRRTVLRLLSEQERLSAGEIAEKLQIAKPTLSGHLNVLKVADLVVAERQGTTIWYRSNMTVLEELLCGFLTLLRSQEKTPSSPEEKNAAIQPRSSLIHS
jgi:DNA-binding transcriptional ArsR family regulator